MKAIDFTSAVAKYLQCSESYLEKRRHHGDGPRFFKLDCYPRYRKCDVDAWVESQSKKLNREYKEEKRGRSRKILTIVHDDNQE